VRDVPTCGGPPKRPIHGRGGGMGAADILMLAALIVRGLREGGPVDRPQRVLDADAPAGLHSLHGTSQFPECDVIHSIERTPAYAGIHHHGG